MKASLFLILTFLVFLTGIMVPVSDTRGDSVWYARPFIGGGYGNGDGTSYQNAFNGLNNIKFNDNGVKPGDTLYVCDKFDLIRGQTFIPISGIKDNPIVIRGDLVGHKGVFNASAQYSFIFPNQSYITFKNVDFIRFFFYGWQSINAKNITFDGCSFANSAGFGCVDLQAGNDDWVFISNSFEYAGNGIYTHARGGIKSANNLTIKGNTFKHIGVSSYANGDSHAIGIQGGQGHIIEGNYIEDTGAAILFYNEGSNCEMGNMIVRGNFIKDIRNVAMGGGITIYNCAEPASPENLSWDISYNITLNTYGAGIYFASLTEKPFKIYNNLIMNSGPAYGKALCVLTKNGINLTGKVCNNIIINPVGTFISAVNGSKANLEIDHNLCYPSNQLPDTYNSIYADPQFVSSNPISPVDFNLKSTSPAIDAGFDLGQTIDFFGNSIQGVPDIGPIECLARIINTPPVAEAGGPYNGNEGSPISFVGSGSTDADGDPLKYRWDFDSDNIWDTDWSVESGASYTWNDNFNGIVKLEVSDGETTSIDQAAVIVNNLPPVVYEITAPSKPIMVMAPIIASAQFIDPGVIDTHTALWDWGDGNILSGTVKEVNGSGIVNGNYTYNSAGIYAIRLMVYDDDKDSGQSIPKNIFVFDPEGGFVTAGGWIESPKGAYKPAPTFTGKAHFSFEAKYKKGDDSPTGNIEFNFETADLNFHSIQYEWLIVTGTIAQFKGSGTINGTGSYELMVAVIDGDIVGDGIDKFRIRIINNTDGSIVYDNQMSATDFAEPTAAISGGSIVIHKDKDKDRSNRAPALSSVASGRTQLLAAYPNPANPEVWIPYQLSEEAEVTVRIYNSSGQLIRTLELGHKTAGIYTSNSESAYWDGKNEAGEQVSSGIYFYNIKASGFTATKKMIIQK